MSIYDINKFIMFSDNKVVRKFPNTYINKSDFIQITGSNWQINKAIVSYIFDIDREYLEQNNFKFNPLFADNNPFKSLKKTYVSPFPYHEVSFFWENVIDEIILGNITNKNMDEFNYYVELFKIEHLLRSNPRILSGGETAKIILISHLLVDPRVIIIDQIMGMIDISTRERFLNDKYIMKKGMLFVIIDQVNMQKDITIWDTKKEQIKISKRNRQKCLSKFEHKYFSIIKANMKKSNTAEVLRIKDLALKIGDKLLFENITLRITRGDIIWVLGPNGSGKTSFFELLIGRIPLLKGSIEVNESIVDKKYVFAYAPQDYLSIITESTLYDEIIIARKHLYENSSNSNKLIKDWLEELRIKKSMYSALLKNDHVLMKFTAVLAAISRESIICCLDEPTIMLTEDYINIIIELIFRNLKEGKSFLISTHDDNFYNIIEKKCKA